MTTTTTRTAGDLRYADYGTRITLTTATGDTATGALTGSRLLRCGDYLIQLENPTTLRRDWYRCAPDAEVNP